MKEEGASKRPVKEVHVSKISINANFITSHVIYKVKEMDDSTKILKKRIAPHGNKNKRTFYLKKDSAVCPPLGICLLLDNKRQIPSSLFVILQWSLVKVNAKSTFIQIGKAERDVFVILPTECNPRMFNWLFLNATYGLLNANTKWQTRSDQMSRDFGFVQPFFVPQLFLLFG